MKFSKMKFTMAAALFGTAFLSACATVEIDSKTAEVGQAGTYNIDGKKVFGTTFGIIAQGASKCFVNGSEIAKFNEDGEFHYINVANDFKTETRTVKCEYSNSEVSERSVGRVFDEKNWRAFRTGNTVFSAIFTGGLGLISGPIASEMNKKQFKVFPIYIHVKAPNVSSEEQDMQKDKDVKIWENLYTKQCNGKQACLNSVPEFFYELRNEDLKGF